MKSKSPLLTHGLSGCTRILESTEGVSITDETSERIPKCVCRRPSSSPRRWETTAAFAPVPFTRRRTKIRPPMPFHGRACFRNPGCGTRGEGRPPVQFKVDASMAEEHAARILILQHRTTANTVHLALSFSPPPPQPSLPSLSGMPTVCRSGGDTTFLETRCLAAPAQQRDSDRCRGNGTSHSVSPPRWTTLEATSHSSRCRAARDTTCL